MVINLGHINDSGLYTYVRSQPWDYSWLRVISVVRETKAAISGDSVPAVNCMKNTIRTIEVAIVLGHVSSNLPLVVLIAHMAPRPKTAVSPILRPVVKCRSQICSHKHLLSRIVY